jgi:hypothetical protein
VDLVPSPKCTLLRQNCEKPNINIEKHWPVLHVLIQMFHIYYYIQLFFEKILRININTTTYNLSLNIKFKKNTLNDSLKTIPGLISVKIVFINVVMNELFFGN